MSIFRFIAFPSLLISVAGFGCNAFAGEAAPAPQFRSPEEQVETFRFADPGYRIELVASEPMVQEPVMIRFDGEGRLWVVEMRGYMQDIERSGVDEPSGRVSVLEDLDGDGQMEKSTVFADNLVLPRSVSIHPNGVLIAENKPLWFYKDTDGDLVADKRTLVDADYAKDNIEHSANGLLRAMDNWIYNAKEGHRYRRSDGEWIRESTEKRGQWGICQDDRGRLFYNYNHSQLYTDLVTPNSLTRNPNHQPSTGVNVGVTNTNEVFPIRPNFATNRGYIPGALDENGSLKQFTSACSPLIYRESLFPEFVGDAFVCETAGNLVKRNRISEAGLHVSGKQAYPDRDFLASSDELFRPSWITTGPDGAIYIADMYRGIVQDGPHMSPYLREHSIARGLDSPVRKGRIWRIVPTGFEVPEAPSFSTMSSEGLVETLAHPSGWWRDQAQMYLVEGMGTGSSAILREMALRDDDESARLHALWTLEGLGLENPETLLRCLKDESPTVQAAAIRVLFSLGISHEALVSEFASLAEGSPPAEVTLQMILTLGDVKMDRQLRFEMLATLLFPRIDDPLMRDAVLSSLGGRELEFFRAVSGVMPGKVGSNSGYAFLVESLSTAVIKSGEPERVEELIRLLGSSAGDWRGDAVMSGISNLGPVLNSKPIKLVAAPDAVSDYPKLTSWFSWPGHEAAGVVDGNVRPLKKREQALFARGRQVYLTSCVACHGADGEGMKYLAPPLAGSDWVVGSKERLARVLFHGLSGPIHVNGKLFTTPEVQSVMPPLANLGNSEIAAVMTYIRREWGNTAEPVSSGEVNKFRIAAQGRTIPWTEEELAPFALEK